MTADCPNCNKPLKGKEGEKLICYTCGTIIGGDQVVQIGMGKYKFIDDVTDYIVPFETKQDLYDLRRQFLRNKEDYKYCRIITPEGVEDIV
jgi:hypothetical protein